MSNGPTEEAVAIEVLREGAMHGLALSQSGALVLSAWAVLFTAAATVVLALFALFPARTALRQLRDARDLRGWREERYEQAFQDALRRAWIEAHAGHSPRAPLTTETIKVIEAFTRMPGVLDRSDTVDLWLGIVWPKMRERILKG